MIIKALGQLSYIIENCTRLTVSNDFSLELLSNINQRALRCYEYLILFLFNRLGILFSLLS